MWWKATTLLTMLVVTTTAGGAQQVSLVRDSVLVPGVRVRMLLSTAPERVVGTIAAAKRDTVVVDTVDVAAQQRLFFPAPGVADEFREVSLPVSAVKRLEISLGRSKLLGVITHGAGGALVSGLIVGLSSVSGRPNPRVGEFLHGFASGAWVGAAIGIPFGYARGSERWRLVLLRHRGASTRLTDGQ